MDEKMYRYYVTDSLRYIPQKKYPAKRYCEIIETAPEPERTGEEIVADVLARLKS